MGENRWREAADWPIPGTKFTKFYFHSKGDAGLSSGGGGLTTDPPETEPVDRYTHDPNHPTPETRRIDSLLGGSVERTAVEKRPDVLVYTSEAITDPVEVTGPLSAVLYLTTSAPSTELWVRLVDVYPDGTAYNVFLTYPNAYRTEWAKEVEKAADGARIVKADIVLPPTGVLFQPGHRIRVEISSGSFPMAVSLNVPAATELTATQANAAAQTIYHDAAHQSHILLPVIPR
jgi:putative CocE/NonD family hydrolase